MVLSRRRLVGLDLREARLSLAILRDCDLSGLDLSGTDLYRTDLSGSIFRGTNFHRNERMEKIKLERARLNGANLAGAQLRKARAKWARFDGADLTGANLSRADLRGTSWDRACLASTILTQADLRQADLRGVGKVGWLVAVGRTFWPSRRPPFILDDTRINGARFATTSQDPWSVLRRAYTGPRMAFVLILSLAALMPLMLQAALYRGLDQVERRAIPPALAAVRRSAELIKARLRETDEQPATDLAARRRIADARAWVDRADELLLRFDRIGGRWFRDRVRPDDLRDLLDVLESSEKRIDALIEAKRTQLEQAVDRAAALPDEAPLVDARDLANRTRQLFQVLMPWVRMQVEPEPVWGLLLGLKQGWITFASVSLLLVYNFLRLGLTYYVSPLRDDEERSGHSPSRGAYVKWMYHFAHRACCLLAAFTLVAGLYQFSRGMSAEVFIPRFGDQAPARASTAS